MTIFVLPFEKMHGLGNDFIMLERRFMPNSIEDSYLAKKLCNRNFGIGADGIIIFDWADSNQADFKWDYYNSDGSIGEMCGNGMRCFAKYIYEKGLSDSPEFKVQTLAGIITPRVEDNGLVTVNIGKPKLPINLKSNIHFKDKTFDYTYIETGNPHAVIFCDNPVEDEIFLKYGPLIECHSNFPSKTNVEFAYVRNTMNQIDLRVWERGAGATLACGTGACATVVAAILNKLVKRQKICVYLPGGALDVWWDKITENLFMSGPSEFVFSGNFNLLILSKTSIS